MRSPVMTIDNTVNEIKYIFKHKIIQIIGAKVKNSDRMWLEGL